jgi:hypothetical protein
MDVLDGKPVQVRPDGARRANALERFPAARARDGPALFRQLPRPQVGFEGPGLVVANHVRGKWHLVLDHESAVRRATNSRISCWSVVRTVSSSPGAAIMALAKTASPT